MINPLMVLIKTETLSLRQTYHVMRNALVIAILFVNCITFAQIQHNVASGETIYKLSKQYKVTAKEIFQANPGLETRSLKVGETILIPTAKAAVSDGILEREGALTHQAQRGETLYAISKKYGVGIEDLIKQNPHLSRGLNQGDVLLIATEGAGRSPSPIQSAPGASDEKTRYQVQAKETLYSLSKRLGVSQEELQKNNPELKNGLKEGMILRIPPQEKNVSSKSSSKTLPKDPKDGFIIYIVKEGDTTFGIMRAYDISLEELLDHNPELKNGLKTGMELRISTHKETSAKIAPTQEGINIVLMLPLLARQAHASELSKHAAAFYLGAKYAIDSMGKKEKIYVKIFDTENDKNKIEKFLYAYDFSPIHAVIGPFFRSSVEQVARALKNKRIPVISPLSASKALDAYPNVIQAEVKDRYLAEPIVKEIRYSSSPARTVYLVGAKQARATAQYFKSLLSQRRGQMRIVETDKLSDVPTDAPPFFAVLFGEDPTLGQSFVKAVQGFEPGQIIPLGVGYNEAYYKNIAPLKKYGFVFTVKYHINKNEAAAQQILDDLQKKFNQAPDKYKLLGFDLTSDILVRLMKNRKLLRYIEGKKSTGLVTKYDYEKLSSGAYVNKGVWLARLRSSTDSEVLKD